LGATLLCASLVVAAEKAANTPGSPTATGSIPGRQLPPPPPKFGGTIEKTAANSKPYWAPRVVPPKGAPNVLLIMTDDTGFGVTSTFGGVVPSPTLERIARDGLRYTNFNSTALCSPTRAALITGRNHHSVGFGVVADLATGFPGYDSIIPRDKATIGRILKGHGYWTSWFGKDHNTPQFQASQAGPFDQWPIGMGFDYFYGFIGGDANQWQPSLFRNTSEIFPYVNSPGWNLTTAMADDAIEYMKRITAINPDQPFFVYYVPGAVHAPHHPTPEWIQRIADMHLFDRGWNNLRETVFANQKRLGVIPQEAKLTPWPKSLKSWDEVTPEERKLFIRQAEVFAAYFAYADHEIGRVIQQIEDMGKLDNTLIIYIAGDNGNSAEGSLVGTPNEIASMQGIDVPVKDQMRFYTAWGTAQTYPHLAVPWTWAFDTPFSWTKQIASHFGGTRQGMAISWPKVITDKGGIRNQFSHMIDIAPTILEATGIAAPATVDGIAQKPLDGTSLVYTFDRKNANAASRHHTQYFEMLGDHAIYHDGWIASTKVMRPPWDVAPGGVSQDPTKYPWELYDLTKDWTQFEDVAAKFPAKLRELEALFWSEAKRYQVLPLDASFSTRFIAPRPSLAAGRTQFTWSGTITGTPTGDAPSLTNTSYTFRADVDIPQGAGAACW
jgi:arylsulfatase